MSKTRIVISKKFNGAAIQVKADNKELNVSVDLDDFIAHVALSAADQIVSAAAAGVGSPALLMTNAQLVAKMRQTLRTTDLAEALLAGAEAATEELKRFSVVAE